MVEVWREIQWWVFKCKSLKCDYWLRFLNIITSKNKNLSFVLYTYIFLKFLCQRNIKSLKTGICKAPFKSPRFTNFANRCNEHLPERDTWLAQVRSIGNEVLAFLLLHTLSNSINSHSWMTFWFWTFNMSPGHLLYH